MLPQTAGSAFPRWFGYYSIWVIVVFKVGAIAFLFRGGPLSWNGLVVVYCPFVLFGLWIPIMSGKLLASLKQQATEAAVEQPSLITG